MVSRMLGYRGIIEFMMDEPMTDTGTVMCQPACRAHLITLYPWLADVDVEHADWATEDDVLAWLGEMEILYGTELPVTRVPRGQL
jgi:hypothetical protein